MQPPPPSSFPPYGYPPPPPARKGMPVWGWVLIGCIPVTLFVVAILAAILFPVFAQARERARQVSCASNEKQIALGLMMYVQDNDNHFPAAPAWMDKTSEYVRSDQAYRCPSAWDHDPAKYGYAYSAKVAGKSATALSDPNAQPTLYDSTDLSRSATDAETSLPSPPRHLHANNVAYADGHVDRVGL